MTIGSQTIPDPVETARACGVAEVAWSAPIAARGGPRILMLNAGGYEGGGIGRAMLFMVRDWAQAAHPASFRMLDTRGRTARTTPLHLPKVLGQLAVAKLMGAVDLVHINVAGRGSTFRKVICSRACEILGLPTIVHLHDYDYAQDLSMRGSTMRRQATRMFHYARRVVVLGLRDRDIALDDLECDSARVVVRHNAVPDPGLPARAPAGDGPVRLLFLGDLSERKGVPELLQALATPALKALNWQLTLAGGGLVDRFKAEAAAAGIAERVTFTGWITPEEVRSLRAQAQIFALPSHAEGQAMSLLEALASGMAIVATPVGSHLEAVSDGVQALLVPPGDVPALAGALARLIRDEALRHRLGDAARARYESGFSTRAYGPAMAGIYAEALAE